MFRLARLNSSMKLKIVHLLPALPAFPNSLKYRTLSRQEPHSVWNVVLAFDSVDESMTMHSNKNSSVSSTFRCYFSWFYNVLSDWPESQLCLGQISGKVLSILAMASRTRISWSQTLWRSGVCRFSWYAVLLFSFTIWRSPAETCWQPVYHTQFTKDLWALA